MKQELSTLRIKNLRLRAYIGFNPEEQEKQQDIVVNATLSYDSWIAAAEDAIEASLDYKRITKRIISYVEGNHFLLLERLTQDILDIIMESSQVIKASVEVDKPYALRFADSVSVTQTADREASVKEALACLSTSHSQTV